MLTRTLLDLPFVASVALPPPGAPTGFTFRENNLLTAVVASWDTPSAGVARTEVWTSTDGLTYTLLTSIPAPGTSANALVPSVGSSKYAKIRWVTSSPGPFTSPLQFFNTDWATRVVTNGGASPLGRETAAVNNAYSDILNQSVFALSDILLFNPLIGNGNYIAMQTPLIRGAGGDPWTALNGSTNGSATINGLDMSVAAESMNSLWSTTNFASDSNLGVSLYAFTAADDGASPARFDYGTYDGVSNQVTMRVNNGGNTIVAMCASGNQLTVPCPGAGFYSLNRVSSTDLRLFWANGSNAIAQQGSTLAGANGSRPNVQMTLGLLNSNGSPTLNTQLHTLSSFVAHNGFDITKAGKLFSIIQAMRIASGGGAV